MKISKVLVFLMRTVYAFCEGGFLFSNTLFTHLEAPETAGSSIPLAALAFLMSFASFLVRDKAKEVRKTLQLGRKRDESLQRELPQSAGLCSGPERCACLPLKALGRGLADCYPSFLLV